MPKPSSFDKGKRIPKMEYKKKLNEYYKKQHPDIYENQAFLKRYYGKCIDKSLFKEIKNEAKKKFKPWGRNKDLAPHTRTGGAYTAIMKRVKILGKAGSAEAELHGTDFSNLDVPGGFSL